MRALSPSEIDTHVAEIHEVGFTVVTDAFEPAFADAVIRRLDGLVAERGIEPAGNDFEGAATYRVYNLLVHGRAFEDIATAPCTLPIVERILSPECLLSSLSSIDIRPGESAQPIHADDQVMDIPKPHPATVCNTMWALTDFTEANGATRIVPGSHREAADPSYGQHYESIAAEMPAGSVLLWHGSLWHGGGANVSGQRRVGVASNYCAGYIRQQENQQLGIPRTVASGFDRRLKRLCGYGTYRGLIGHIDKTDPLRMLDPDADLTMLWDQG